MSLLQSIPGFALTREPSLSLFSYLSKDSKLRSVCLCRIINSAHGHGCKEGSRGETTLIGSTSYLPDVQYIGLPE